MRNANDNHIGALRQSRVRLGRRRILVVEDEALVAMLIEEFLHDAGAEVVGAVGSVAEALSLIEQMTSDGGLDGAVLDIHLDGEAVTPVADRLAALGVPFLFATGYGDDRGRGEHATAPILHKPFAFAALVAAVGSLPNSKTSESSRPLG